jgi:hypothetical protein
MILPSDKESKMARWSRLSISPRNIRHLCRAASLIPYGIVPSLYTQANELKVRAYNEICHNDAPMWPMPDRDSLWPFFVLVLVALIPVVCSRRRFTVATNLFLSIVTLLWALRLQVTAATPPYECYTQAGTYEDHVSGLDEFEICFFLFVFISYVLFLADWCIWGVRRSAPFFKRQWKWLAVR